MVTCKICNLESNTINALSHHFRSTHQITAKEYYDNFLKIEKEGTCTECNAPTKFNNITRGYSQYCSNLCKNQSTDRISKICQTKDTIYGRKWSAIYKKQKETVNAWTKKKKDEYSKNLSAGAKKAHKLDPTIRKRTKQTQQNRYTTEEYSNLIRQGHLNRSLDEINDANQKRKQTELLKYGVESHTQTDEHKIKRKERDAIRTTEEKESIIKKIISSNIAAGHYLPLDHPDRRSKKEYKNKVRSMSEFWAKLKFTTEELTHRGLNGVDNAVQLDHIVSLETCYRQGIPIEIASHWVNLRLISWQENIHKYSTDHMSVTELIEAVNTYNEMKHLK